MSKPILRLLGIAALLLLLQIMLVNGLLGARGNSASLATAEVSTSASANSPPAEAFAQDNGRYDIVLIPKDSNYHLMIDTAEGRVWQARYKIDGTIDHGFGGSQNTYQVSNWRQVEVTPSPPVKNSSPGRFRVHSNFEAVKETFLHDTQTGYIYLMLAIDDQQNVMFKRLPVEGQ